MRRILIAIPILVLFIVSGLTVLAARAPKTWAVNWSTPVSLATLPAADLAVARLSSSHLGFLWTDATNQNLSYTATNAAGRSRTWHLDRGYLRNPSIVGEGTSGIGVGAWIHLNSSSMNLEAAVLTGKGPSKRFVLVSHVGAIEHPDLFIGPHGTIDVVFSWQHPDQYNVFLGTISLRLHRLIHVEKLTNARYYSFYPRAVVDGDGHIVVLHLESCCSQSQWNLSLDRFSAAGMRLGPSRVIDQVSDSGDTGAWAEDLRTDEHGNVWGAFSDNSGIAMFELLPNGRLQVRPTEVDPLGGPPPSTLALSLAPSGDYLFWQVESGVGSYIEARRFNSSMVMGTAERTAYESGEQTEPYAYDSHGRTRLVWLNSVSGFSGQIQMSSHRLSGRPSLLERLGLGVGNAWEDLGVIIVGGFGVAAIASAGNVLTVFGLVALGLLFMRVARRFGVRWQLYALFLAGALFALFVEPGGPLLFLKTLPASGLPALPYGILATLAALGLVLWLSNVPLRHADDVYRVGVMACAGVFFFAFVEAVTLLEGQLGFLG